MEYVSYLEFCISPIYTVKEPEYPTKSYVVLNGQKTNMIIGGIVLESCIRVYDYYLVFTTYDCPFEEGLTVSLLDKNGKILEGKDIFVAYYTDDFSDLKLYPPNIVTFDFLYKGLWRIEVFPPIETSKRSKEFLSIWKRKFKSYWKVTLDLNEEGVLIPFKVRQVIVLLICFLVILYICISSWIF